MHEVNPAVGSDVTNTLNPLCNPLCTQYSYRYWQDWE